jgi:hypothetical protein
MTSSEPISASTAESNFAVFPTDARISYPSYKSLDEFMDTERLAALDGYITSKLKKRIADARDIEFYTGPHTITKDSLAVPGTRMVYLSRAKGEDRYLDLDRTELWELTEDAIEFALLMDFIKTLPFKATGRMLIMYDTQPRPVTAHRDHMEQNICHEFIWFRSNKKKPFYMLNHVTGDKKYVASFSAWFDTVNQFHGADGYDGLSFSIRVDGVFSDAFRAQITKPEFNLSSMPSLWACTTRDD